MYTIFIAGNTQDDAPALYNWLDSNDLNEKVTVLSVADTEENASRVAEFSIALPSLVAIKKEIHGTAIVCDKIAEGLDAILNLSAEAIGEINRMHSIMTAPTLGGNDRGFGRRIA